MVSASEALKAWIAERAKASILYGRKTGSAVEVNAEQVGCMVGASGEAWQQEFGTAPPNGLVMAVHLSCLEQLPHPQMEQQ